MTDDRAGTVSESLHEAAETHHVVYRITAGTDDDWATWYSDWLVNHSELGEILGATPVRSELTALLVELDRAFNEQKPSGRWEDFYAAELVERLSSVS